MKEGAPKTRLGDVMGQWTEGPPGALLLWCALLVLAGILVGHSVALLSKLSPVLMPFLLAAFLAYLGDPLVVRLQRLNMGRTFSVCMVFLLLSAVIVLFIILLLPSLERQISMLVNKIPDYRQRIENDWLPYFYAYLPDSMGKAELVAYLKELLQQVWPSIQGLLSKWIPSLWGSGAKLLVFFTNLLIVPVVAFYLLRDWESVLVAVRRLIPGRIEKRLLLVVLSAFIRGQLLVMISLGLFYAIGLRIVGLELGLLVGLIAGAISFIPYLGTFVGLILAILASLLQFGDWLHLVLAMGVFGVGQMLESTLFTPLLVGDKIGLHPVLVIFAVLVGGHLFGFTGVLLALPVAAVMAATIRHFYRLYVREDQDQEQEHGANVSDEEGAAPGQI
jgi:predicted PurR-regulated permease PerM